jgi:long-chain acyl-CoA synthetase
MNKSLQTVADPETAEPGPEPTGARSAPPTPAQKDTHPPLPRYAGDAPVRSQFPSLTVPALLEQAAKKFPRQTALIYFGARISYAQLLRHVKRCAAGLQALGVRKNDRVALMMSNCPQFVIGYFGTLRAGAIVTATSSMYTRRETAHQWHDAGATIALVEQRFYSTARAVRSDVPELRSIVVTSGREYYPKALAALDRSLQAGRKTKLNKAAPPATPPATLRWRELLSLARAPLPASRKPSDIACLQYTGGTTGTSKGAMLTHSNLATNAHQIRHWLVRGQEKEVMVASLPLFHIYAMTCVMISSVMAGGTVVILPRFELRAALNIIRKYHPTIFHGVPTMYVAFNNAPKVEEYGFKSLRVCMSGGAPLPVEVQQAFESLSGGRLVEGYGLTEASPTTHVNPPDGLSKVGSIGLPIPGTDARIVDIDTGTREMAIGETGELVIRGPQVMKGYWNKPKETAAVLRHGWLYTGDIARRDEDGYFYIVDRKKDLIIAGGFNIYPREVEEVLFEHPQIKEAVVIGMPDPYRGETVKAFVVLKDGGTTVEEIIAWCRERLASYKVPRQIEFRDSLPKSGVGKYLRRELRQEAIAVATSSVRT